MMSFSLRSLLLAAFVLSNCISWTASRHHYTHNVSGHRSRHRRQGAGLYLSASYVLPEGEGDGWGEWGEVSPCSRSCGGGVASQKRICLNLGPDGKPQCGGGDTKYFSCETQDCPAGSRDFREQQCSEFDDVLFRDTTKYRWVPYTQAPNPCELNCMPHGERFYYRHRPAVVDGTRCNDESFDVCVNGICQPVGCDMMLGSSAREDKCRECRGQGVNCQTTDGIIDSDDLRKGYNDVLLIPQGATSIVIAERRPSRNYLALHATNGTYYLNGAYQIDFPRSLMIAGAQWSYERSQQGFAAPDKLRCLGPTNEPLILALLLQEDNVGVEYEYSVPNERAPPTNKQYNWAHEEFSPCSAPCGGGYQTRNVSCRSREELELVDEVLCDKDLKPPTNQTCNTEACEAQWTPEPWEECSKRCGEGGTRSRVVHCTQIISNGYPSIVGEKTCFEIHGPKPPLHETCNENATCPIWFTGPWKPCDKLCDEGKQTRQVVCYQKNGSRKEILNDKECEDKKPSTEQSCMLQPCDGVDWVLSEWVGCDSCLSTVRTRTAVCTTKRGALVNDSFCAYHETPVTEEPCDRTKLPPCQVQWYATQWSKCSVDCGKGVQARRVFCGVFDGASVMKVDDSRCDGQPKYNTTKDCEVPQDQCPSKFYAGPWGVCNNKCGGGLQYREVMCLRGGKLATDCTEKAMVPDSQDCNTGPCDKDELLPVNMTLSPFDDDYEDCIEEVDEFPEVGLDGDGSSTVDFSSTVMLSDTPTEGSGWSTSPAELEMSSPFDETETTRDEFLTTETGSGSEATDFEGSGETFTINFTDTTDTTDLELTGTTETESTGLTGSTESATADTGSTERRTTANDTANLKKLEKIIDEEKIDSDESYFDSSEEDEDDNYSFYSESSTDYEGSPETTSTEDKSVYTTAFEETSETDTTGSEGSTLSSESGSTNASEPATLSGSTDSSVLFEGSIRSEATTDTNETSESEPTAATVAGTAESTETTETESAGTTETSEVSYTVTTTTDTKTTESTETTETGTTESTDTSEAVTTESTEITESKTAESTETTETGTTESTETTETKTTESTETTETGTTESTETTESKTTESTETTERKTIDSSETTEAGTTESTETSETGTTESTETKTTESSEATEAGTTESTETSETRTTESTETTESKTTDSSETTEAATTESTETTEAATTESTETTESKTTESTETTESKTTESTETTEGKTTESTETTETGTTESTEATESKTTESTETTDIRTTESTETTEASTTESTEITESKTTESTETTETGSTESTETTETKTTESTETTETGTTESVETTETKTTGSPETTETGTTESTETAETGSTESTETTKTGSTETTESYTSSTESTFAEESSSTESTEGGSTLSSEATESSSESPTTEAASSGTTRWDLTSTMGEFTTRKSRVCRPRSCSHTEFGCCPDKKTPALGPFDAGCPKPRTCEDSIYGCCPDAVSPAQGPLYKGCPVEPCAETLFGCCESDNITAAEGNDQEGCPPPPPACLSSRYGCCNDKTEATGPGKEGCPETSTTVTSATESEQYTESIEGWESTTEGSMGTGGSTESEGSTKLEEGSTKSEEGSTKSGGCNESEYGCCFDNETPATGPELQGCPCNASQFGCCPDGFTSAQDAEFNGCEKSCNTSAFGCCPDGLHPAHGPDQEGCCLTSSFGCCPDNHKPAEGPHLEGCGCQYSHFGCCLDNVTIATGPNNKGCGCQYAEHGCCPDRHTEASGPEFEGCLCHTYQFGCCPDGVTISTGPNGQGCYCQYSKFGCCGDEQTHAKGLDRQGCDCSTTKHGCCLDGVTEATGPKFEGCTDKPVDRQAACYLKFERGPCRNYSVGWFYDTEYGGCSRFWYGGCEGNGNRFSSKEECEDICVSPPPKETCRLPQVKGACSGYHQRWYYDTEREMCSNFIYGGCLGNKNNFESRELCQAQCEPERALDQCSLTIERGSCMGNYLRWGYNKEAKSCEQFVWGGCEGNTNRFSSEAACMLRCNPPGEPQPECSEPQVEGTCNDTEARWSFSQTENRCIPYYYKGCGGEGNKYTTREECEVACPSAYVPELCTLPAATGDCYDYREKWYFDTKSQNCERFYYGGCGGNENRFNSEQECVNRCIPPPTTPPPAAPTAAPQRVPDTEAYCFMEIDAGPCSHNITTKWGYDSARGKCMSFQFGGCGGNQNNFLSEEICSYYCKPIQDICQLPMLSGPCDESVMRWFYDAATDSCSQFTYGGCDGNDNRFESREQCENRCKSGPASTVSTTTTTAKEEQLPSECAISPVLETCSRDTMGEMWYYNDETSECNAHQNLESGRECRVTGVFYSQEACERSCGGFRNIDVCQYDVEPGPCHNYRSKYFYNKTTSRCEEFVYGGCFGGANRFSTEQECEQVCMISVDPCTLPAEPGNCVGYFEKWYYNPDSDQCYPFVYGGCGGNNNKFESREACEGRCRRQPPASTTLAPTQTTRQYEPEPEECRTPASLAPCGSNETVYYFDEAAGRCEAANIGGCRSSAKLYRSEEECERSCGVFRGIDVCRAGLDPGPCRSAIPKFYFDAASGSCQDFTYGGCQGGPNRFSSREECQEVCASSGPAAACLLPVATGEACAEVPERRWHYDVTRAGCLVFSYQGCGGNANNFGSYEECAYYCTPASPEVPSPCDRYAEECVALEGTCAYGMRYSTTAEGCSRCECQEPVSCDVHLRECDALRCHYGIERSALSDGCIKCKCSEDPCSRNPCASTERCVVVESQDPSTLEAIYSAQCESNEIYDCKEFESECSRLRCQYGIQRTRVGSCERCACVREEANCTLLRQECEGLKCLYGLARTLDADGCERCVCLKPPCETKRCPAGERCVSAPFRDPATHETRYAANCKPVSKAGACPAAGEPVARSTESACRQECADDADCRGVLKCCARGCSQLCLPPAPPTTPRPSTTHTPDVPRAPEADSDTEHSRPQVEAAEGGKATLRCYFHGNPPPKITWRFGEVTIEGDAGRYRLLSDGALEIISLFRNDSGVYICVAQNEHGSAQQQVTLTVADPVDTPAAVASAESRVTGELGRVLVVRCPAYGYPPPSIFWYRGRDMVPYSNALYEARGQELQIRRLAVETLGEYECQAYNGRGKPATWRAVVQANRPPGETRRSPYLVAREVLVTPRPPAPAPPTTTEKPFITVPPYIVPVHTSLPATSSGSVGAQISLPCEVNGYPQPEVRWSKDDVPLATSDRIWIAGSRLTIERAEVSDSGVYSCQAANMYSSHASVVRVTVQEMSIPATCVDNPTFANCALIVQSRFCVHRYYSKFCCKSCVEAGQLNPSDALMQADQSLFRK